MLTHFFFSFVCSVIFALILSFIFKRRAPGPFNGILYFFGIIFTFTAALGLLLTPMGPMYKNVPVLSIAAIALLVMLLIAELLPHHEKAVIVKRKLVKSDEERDEETLQKEFSILLVLILVILVGAVIYAITAKPETFHMTF